MNRAKRIGLFIVVFSLSLSFASGEAQEKKGIDKGEGKGLKSEKGFGFTSSRAPIDITSDTVEANQKENTVAFKGNVVAKQEETTLYANNLVITYDSNTKKIKEIVATGNVKIVQLDRRATGQKATFYQEQNKIVFEGDAVLREGENVVRGERVIHYADEERSVVEPGKEGRVSTRITPPPKEEGQEKKPKEGKEK
ncbi:MAG: lipopolysaccharide transport periplasmic protein LptA [Thermodesulfobacteriota bacterium]